MKEHAPRKRSPTHNRSGAFPTPSFFGISSLAPACVLFGLAPMPAPSVSHTARTSIACAGAVYTYCAPMTASTKAREWLSAAALSSSSACFKSDLDRMMCERASAAEISSPRAGRGAEAPDEHRASASLTRAVVGASSCRLACSEGVVEDGGDDWLAQRPIRRRASPARAAAAMNPPPGITPDPTGLAPSRWAATR